ncbi:DNA-3-methyladenine glycosylase 2 family protein [Paenalcaligenes niemegkensis]|uniref:DNA-3-methyladenine glycosylase family protein n=1 Tax=Paenalcaligenes niemegkensis TaxID=2895469 RepID=UPI001EE913F8|nr:DNA-3-methyladenine glycosylase 2 family protein [Paenalcaligenes niemegkensis]MCQ9615743.1 DNA-3-methyladenine glycosylase 2 family protein [Paenalcaligenes niemegkensis]
MTMTRPEYWEEAKTHLMKRDRILRKIIPMYADEWLRPPAEPFVTLVRAIIGQQVSRRTADTVWTRFASSFDTQATPQQVLDIDIEALRKFGLPKRKAEYILDLATHFDQRKVEPDAWHDMDDDAIIKELCAIRGIGRWTAEMFLIFNLHRADVLPLDDAGLIKAISQHYYSGEPVSRFEAREVAQAWTPWCTVATWYLWRSLDPVVESE